MKDNITPEEKLLALIRQPKRKMAIQEDSASPQMPASKQSAAASISLNKEYGTGGKVRYWRHGPTFNSPEILLGIVHVIMVVCLIFLITTFVYPLIGVRKMIMPVKKKEVNIRPQVRLSRMPLEKYLEAVSAKGLFNNPAEIQETLTAVDSDLLKEISLVGIIMGMDPQAVVEDKRTQTTLYINKGEFIGDARVEDIKQGKVIIEYRDQRYELNL
jgi:hypothetical protein